LFNIIGLLLIKLEWYDGVTHLSIAIVKFGF